VWPLAGSSQQLRWQHTHKLKPLDNLMAQMGCFYVRYMDDWVSQFWILDCEEIGRKPTLDTN